MFNKSDISASITAITILYTIVFLFVKVWKNIVKPAINKIHTVASNKGFVSSKHINSVVTASIDRKTEANHSDVVTDSFDSSYESFDFETANDIPHVSLNSMYVKTILLNQYKKPKYIHNSNSQYSGVGLWKFKDLRY